MEDFKHSGMPHCQDRLFSPCGISIFITFLSQKEVDNERYCLSLYYDISQVYLTDISDFMTLKIDQNLGNMVFQSFLFRPDGRLLYHGL